jgi:hypothetical protein
VILAARFAGHWGRGHEHGWTEHMGLIAIRNEKVKWGTKNEALAIMR